MRGLRRADLPAAGAAGYRRVTPIPQLSPANQLRTVRQEMSEGFKVRHTASAWTRPRPANRARNSFRSPLATTGSVNGSALLSRPWARLCAASMRSRASLSLSSAPTWMIHPVWAATGLMAPFCWMVCDSDWPCWEGSAIACEAEEAGTLDAGSTPSRPLPVPWLAGCGGISVLATSALLISALATIALDVSGTSERGCGMALVMEVPEDWAAEASFICPALIWTVFTLTGFIGSDEPGIAAIGWV